MLHTPEHSSDVAGIFLNIIVHDDKPVLPENGGEQLLNGYVEIITVSDGSNPFYPTAGSWRTYLVRAEEEELSAIASGDASSIFPLQPDDELTGINVHEKKFALGNGAMEQFGLWQFIDFHRPGEGDLTLAVLFKSLDDLSEQQLLRGGN